MNDIIAQTEKRQVECNRRAGELYKKLTVAENEAVSMINYLNSQKLRIFIVTVKNIYNNLVKKFRGK